MKQSSRGFTVVEIIIVVVVIGILIGIAMVAWGGAAVSSRERARTNDLNQWVGAFDIYKGRSAGWPLIPLNDGETIVTCLGSPADTPASNPNKCGKVTSAAAGEYLSTNSGASGGFYSTLQTEMTKVGKMSKNSGPDVKGLYRGPFAHITQVTTAGTARVTVRFINYFESSSCPTNTTAVASLPAPNNGLVSGLASGVRACEISNSSFTYRP